MTVDAFSVFFALLTAGAQLFVVVAAGVWLAARTSPRVAAAARELRAYVAPIALPLAWIVAMTATAGSLYYSEVAGFVPCKLCWFQRIAMYPMSLLLGIAVAQRDVMVRRYLIPLAAAGALISIYHYQLERFPSQTHLSCAREAPCTLVYVWHFHYISIPMMALSAFALIITLLMIARPDSAEASEPAALLRETEGATR